MAGMGPVLCWPLLSLLHTALLLAAAHGASVSGSEQVTTVRGLYSLMYRDQKGTGGLYKLLNATGMIGSESPPYPEDPEVDAPLLFWQDVPNPLTAPHIVLVPVKTSLDFFSQWQQRADLQQHIAGVLVDDTDPPDRYSTVGLFPGAAYAPYPAKGYQWNPAGVPLSASWLPAPVFLLTPEMAGDAQQRARHNQQANRQGRLYRARLNLAMTAKHNSSYCIGKGVCKPLGGFSSWAAVPPLAAGASLDKPTTLVVAQIDGMDMFHDSIQGANSPLSGLLALLMAARILQQQQEQPGPPPSSSSPSSSSSLFASRRLVLLALAGEGWGYQGSRRVLWEMSQGTAAVEGLQLHMIDQVVELGALGRCTMGSSGTCQLFAHSQGPPDFGDAAELVATLQQGAGDVPGTKVVISPASPSNPGIPPSSLMSFLRINSSIKGVVLTEYDSAISDPYYGSRFDNGSRVQPDAVAAAAAAVAAGLYRLVGGQPSDLKLNMTLIREGVDSLVSCLLLPSPGLSCPLATSLLLPGYRLLPNGSRDYSPQHYLGVLQTVPADHQDPRLKNDVYRFIWNLLGAFTSTTTLQTATAACDPFTHKCPAGQVCVGWKQGSKDTNLMGRCLNASVHYVPSYSTRFGCDNCDDWLYSFRWRVTEEADAWSALYGWPEDPMWTESDWPLGIPTLQLYLKEPPANDVAVLVAGLVVTAAAVVGSMVTKAALEKTLKRA